MPDKQTKWRTTDVYSNVPRLSTVKVITHTRQSGLNTSTSVPCGLTHGVSLSALGWAAVGIFVISGSLPSGARLEGSGQP